MNKNPLFLFIFFIVSLFSIFSSPIYAKNTKIKPIKIKKTNSSPTKQIITPISTNADSEFTLDQKLIKLKRVAPSLNRKVLKLALTAYMHANAQGIGSKQIFTVIDYSLPSNARRLWVFNLANNRLLFHTLVSHGKNSGWRYARRFSNRPGSRETSPGLYITKNTYYGHEGYSLRLIGLSKGFNNNAFRRDIVFHGAWYVSEYYAHDWDRIGRSWGCFAVPENEVRPIINTIKDGSLIFAYAPDRKWRDDSPFLQTL